MVLLAGLLLAGAAAAELQPRLAPEQAEQIAARTDDPLVAADAYSRAWMHQEALDVLEASEREDAAVLWRLARSRIDLAENLEGDAAEPHYEKALARAEQAVQLEPDNADAQLIYAIASGRIALLRNIFKAPGLVKQAYRHAHLAVDRDRDKAIALYVLGRTHKSLMAKSGFARTVAGLTFADADSIGWYFEKALDAANGEMVQCRVEYADYLMGEGENPSKARVMLEAALALPLRDEQDLPAQERAREMLKKLE
jgi:hypothetical protein